MGSPTTTYKELRRLARLHSIQTVFTDTLGRRRAASDDALVALLRAMGVAIGHAREAARLAELRERELGLSPLDHVVVRRSDGPFTLPLRQAVTAARLKLEDGDVLDLDISTMSGCSLRFPARLPIGYHSIEVEGEDGPHRATLLRAPLQVPSVPGKRWGVFAPLYAVSRDGRGEISDTSEAMALAEWAAGLGASAFATLPLLASYLDHPFDPSPYAPVSRLFWNELYLDVAAIPEAALLDPSEVEALRTSPSPPLVDYRTAARGKRAIVQKLADLFFAKGEADRRAAYERFLSEFPLVKRYARFRAVGETRAETWPLWPEPERSGDLGKEPFDAAAERYHLFAQWLMHEQMSATAARARAAGCPLYLDFPLGSNAHGFDVWNEPHLYVRGAAIGAPPDLAYASGQNWGFRPPHPDTQRRDGYRHFAAALRHQMSAAAMIRLDHVMGLHRMYWIADGFPATEGVYVRYRANEIYAVLAIEASRAGCEVIGEDLGTVPSAVRMSMKRHGVKRLFVLQRQLAHVHENPPGEVPPNAVASINTHDMHPFAAFWSSADIDEKLQLGVIPAANEERERERRRKGRELLLAHLRREGFLRADDEDEAAILRATLSWLASSEAAFVLVNLEDLWLETTAQNVPTTTTERPNWRPRLRLTIERLREDRGVQELLRLIEERRRKSGNGPAPSPSGTE
jgi:4-alpha-glucanotransferase